MERYSTPHEVHETPQTVEIFGVTIQAGAAEWAWTNFLKRLANGTHYKNAYEILQREIEEVAASQDHHFTTSEHTTKAVERLMAFVTTGTMLEDYLDNLPFSSKEQSGIIGRFKKQEQAWLSHERRVYSEWIGKIYSLLQDVGHRPLTDADLGLFRRYRDAIQTVMQHNQAFTADSLRKLSTFNHLAPEICQELNAVLDRYPNT